MQNVLTMMGNVDGIVERMQEEVRLGREFGCWLKNGNLLYFFSFLLGVVVEEIMGNEEEVEEEEKVKEPVNFTDVVSFLEEIQVKNPLLVYFDVKNPSHS